MFLPPFLCMSPGIYVKFLWLCPRNTYWVLWYTDVQLYTIWFTFWGPNEVTMATWPRWECGQDVLRRLSWRVCGGNWAPTLYMWQGTYRMRWWCPERWDREGTPPTPVTMGISFQGVSHPGWGRGGLGTPKRADKGFSPSWQYLHLGLGSCVSLIYPEGEGLSGTEFHLPILRQWSLPISFISLCICTLLKFSQLERGTIISTDEVWRRKSFPKLHHLGQMLEQIISPS